MLTLSLELWPYMKTEKMNLNFKESLEWEILLIKMQKIYTQNFQSPEYMPQ